MNGTDDATPGSAFVAEAFLSACRAEIASLKPGNVHVHAPGHRMDAATFERAAQAAAPVVADRSKPVGARILAATQASFAAAGCNANLGILLLAVPLAAAYERLVDEAVQVPASALPQGSRSPDTTLDHDRSPALRGRGRQAEGRASHQFPDQPPDQPFRNALAQILGSLDAADTAAIFAAIAHASPGGLGDRAEHDVRRIPSIGIIEAMGLAAETDLVARQYVSGFEDIFDIGFASLAASLAPGLDNPALGRALVAYLAFASKFPDSHVTRKFGSESAERVRAGFAAFRAMAEAASSPGPVLQQARNLDAALKAEGLNPGTSADLTVATLFAATLAEEAGR